MQSKIAAKFSMETQCPTSRVSVQPLGNDRYVASGCESATVYRCRDRNFCVTEDDSTNEETVKVALVAIPKTDGVDNRTGKPQREKTPAGNVRISLNVELEKSIRLNLSAEPSNKASPLVMRLTQIATGELDGFASDCTLGLLLNGERIDTGKTRHRSQGIVTTLSVELSPESIVDFGTARQLTVGSCERRFTLSAGQLAQVHSFVNLFDEELAWKSDPKTGTSSALLAPAGGWPVWTITTTSPKATAEGRELNGSELFTLLKPSVFQVEALRGERTAQGSAVAVSTTELLTNCHVLEGSRKILVKNAQHEYVATLSRSLPAADRCVLAVKDATLTAVRGVRDYSSLKVGEPLYTLGSPNGLELTLSNGILSGLRQESPWGNFVQTTAPISPGSSGGGLFDSRGNLIGITTLAVVGRERLNQALNFAIAADGFWQDEGAAATEKKKAE